MSTFECIGLSKNYGSNQALKNIDLKLEPGKIVGLLGPNGSGKTTLIKLVAGLLAPSEGKVLIDGEMPGMGSKSKVAYLPDRDFLPNYMSIEKLIKYYSDFFDDFDIERALEMLKSLDLCIDDSLGKLSKGNREKVQLILTMSRRAQIYLLDEPIAGVDPAARDYILRTIIANYNPEGIMLISTHLIANVETVLDDVIFLRSGEIVLHGESDAIREEKGMSIDGLFREVFKC